VWPCDSLTTPGSDRTPKAGVAGSNPAGSTKKHQVRGPSVQRMRGPLRLQHTYGTDAAATYSCCSHGLTTRAPVRATCLMLRVATVQPLARAVAAIRASGGSMLVPAALSVLWMVR
jgi:hypothetical protein